MKITLTLYLITVTQSCSMSEQGQGYSLTPWGRDTDRITGLDDGGREYELPENVEAGETADGQPAVFERGCNRSLALLRHAGSGRPQLAGFRDRSMPVLSLA